MRVCTICQGGNFWGTGRVACREAACDAWRSQTFAREFGACFPGNFFLNGALWSIVSSKKIFEEKNINIYFLYKNNNKL